MAKDFSRKDLKRQDEFLSTATRLTQWFMQRRKAAGLAALVLVAAASVLVGVWSYRARQEQNAAALLAVALRVYNSPVTADDAGDAVAAADEHSAVGHAHFPTDKAKFEAAVAALEPIVSQYRGQPSGRMAAFYLGSSFIALKQPDEAVAALEQATKSSSPLVRALSSYRLGELYVSEKKFDEALAVFDPLAADSPTGFPREEALAAKARTHEAAGDQQAAMLAYQRIVEDYPTSIYAATARTRAEELAASLGVDLDAESN